MVPPCTRPLTLVVPPLLPTETVGAVIGPLEMKPPRCSTWPDGYVKVAPRLPAPGSHATGWTVIMPVVGPFDDDLADEVAAADDLAGEPGAVGLHLRRRDDGTLRGS